MYSNVSFKSAVVLRHVSRKIENIRITSSWVNKQTYLLGDDIEYEIKIGKVRIWLRTITNT